MSKRRIIANVSSIFLPILVFVVVYFLSGYQSPGLADREMTSLSEKAIDISLEAQNSLASLSIGLLGGIWGLLLTQSDKSKLKNGFITPFVGGSLSLIFSYVGYRLAARQYVEMLFNAETIDLNAPFARYWPSWQVVLFGLGFLILALALYDYYHRRN